MATALMPGANDLVVTTAGEAFGAGDVGKPVAVSLDGTQRAVHATSLAGIVGVVLLGATVALNGAITYYKRATVLEVDLPDAGPTLRSVFGQVGGTVDLEARTGRRIGHVVGFGRAQGLAVDHPSPDWTQQLLGTVRPSTAEPVTSRIPMVAGPGWRRSPAPYGRKAQDP